MSAITGNYCASSRKYGELAFRWLYHPGNRSELAKELLQIRSETGSSHEAKEYRNYLLWLGVYPVILREHRNLMEVLA